MNKTMFKRKDVRKIINIKNNNSTVKFKIYNYTQESKKYVLDIYEKKYKLGYEDFSLEGEELKQVIAMFTDCLFSLDELAEILDSPNVYFEQILNEIEIILSEIAILFVQEKTKELMKLKLDDEIANMSQTVVDMAKENV